MLLLSQDIFNASACPPTTHCWSCSRSAWFARRSVSKTAAGPCADCLWQAGGACGCRDRELLAQAGLHSFKSNAACFWVSQQKANALNAMHAKAKFRQKFQAWRQWAGKRCLLRDRLRLVLIACRRTTLVAGTAMQDIRIASRHMIASRICYLQVRPSTRCCSPFEAVLS